MSQLQLAQVSGYSQRHISFLEIGRSRPTRGAVLVLAEAVCDSLEERNAMLRAAEFADEYPRSTLDGEELQRVLATCRRTLDGLAPFPAILIDARWDVLASNSAAIAFFGQFQRERLWEGAERNAMRTHFEPGGLRPFIVDWPRVAHHFMTKVRLRLLVDSNNEVADGIARDFGEEVNAFAQERCLHHRNCAWSEPLSLPNFVRRDERPPRPNRRGFADRGLRPGRQRNAPAFRSVRGSGKRQRQAR